MSLWVREILFGKIKRQRMAAHRYKGISLPNPKMVVIFWQDRKIKIIFITEIFRLFSGKNCRVFDRFFFPNLWGGFFF